jgi:hypothetical protein
MSELLPPLRPQPLSYYGDGKFEFMSDSNKKYLQNAHWAISICELWDWLRTYSPEIDKGFMFSKIPPELQRIYEKMMEQDIAHMHSGSSHASTMRAMEFIAKNGYEAYRRNSK